MARTFCIASFTPAASSWASCFAPTTASPPSTASPPHTRTPSLLAAPPTRGSPYFGGEEKVIRGTAAGGEKEERMEKEDEYDRWIPRADEEKMEKVTAVAWF